MVEKVLWRKTHEKTVHCYLGTIVEVRTKGIDPE